MIEHLSKPEYVHVLLNPLPVYGLGVSLLGLIIALLSRTKAARVTALALVMVSAASAWPVYHYGEAGYDRVKSMVDEAGDKWLDEHMARGEKFIAVFYVLTGLALIAIAAPAKWPRSSVPLAVVTFVVGIAALSIGSWDRLRGRACSAQRVPVRSPAISTRTAEGRGLTIAGKGNAPPL